MVVSMSLESERMCEKHPTASSPKPLNCDLVVRAVVTRLIRRRATARTSVVANAHIHDDGGSAERRGEDRRTGLVADAEGIALVRLATEQSSLEAIARAIVFAGIHIQAHVDRIHAVGGSARFPDTVFTGIEHRSCLAGPGDTTECSNGKRFPVAEVTEAGRSARGSRRRRRRVMRRRLSAGITSHFLRDSRRSHEGNSRKRNQNQVFHDHFLLLIARCGL